MVLIGRLKQVKIYLDDTQYEKLRKIAEQQGLSAPALVKSLVLEFLGEVEYGDLVTRIKDLEKKYAQLSQEIRRIERDLILLAKRCSRR
ncbi:MAG: hypothetical protein DRJ52_10070 [Thermoprotei archaeon]|nr:MAG: hypothetical protein DRJ52_10070 [Thermoprotei archaeon]